MTESTKRLEVSKGIGTSSYACMKWEHKGEIWWAFLSRPGVNSWQPMPQFDTGNHRQVFEYMELFMTNQLKFLPAKD